MTKQEFEKQQQSLQEKLRMPPEIVDHYTLADFVLGCYYDERKKWIVFENNEWGFNYVLLETESEEAAYNKLYSWVQFNIEVKERLKSRYKNPKM